MTATDAQLSPTEAAHWTRIGALSALAMLLGYLESFLPIPIPGVKLGLANIPILVALAQGDVTGAFFVGLVKVSATSVLFGNPITLAYSLVGTLLAFLVMAPLSRLRTMRLEMVSVMGALAHEAGQLLVAQALLGTPLVWYSAPMLAVAGCVTGVLCGVVAQRLITLMPQQSHETEPSSHQVNQASFQKNAQDNRATATVDAPQDNLITADDARMAQIPTQRAPEAPLDESATQNAASRLDERTTDKLNAQKPHFSTAQALCLLGSYLVFIIIVMHAHSFQALALSLACSIALCIFARTRVHQMVAALAPTIPIALMTLIAQVATHQHGIVIASLGSLLLTQEAFEASITMLLRLMSIAWASLGIARLLEPATLLRCAHTIVAPLNHFGVRTAGPELAFATTLQLLPLLFNRVQTLNAQGFSPLSRSFWTNEIPTLIAGWLGDI